MNIDKSNPAGKVFEKWAIKIIMALSIPALGLFIYLTILENRSSTSYDSRDDKPDRIIQGMICRSLMVKDKPSYVNIHLHNTNPESELTATVSVTAPNFNLNPPETTIIEEGLSSNWYASPGWWVTPTQTGKQFITFSATTDNGLSNAVTCEITVLDFLGLEIEKIYGFTGGLMGASIALGVKSWREKRKQNQSSSQEAG